MSMKVIETITLASAASSFTFSNIPQVYTDLYVVFSGRTTNTQYGYDIRVRPNGSTTNGSGKVIRAYVGSAVDSYTTSYVFISDNSRGDAATANTFLIADLYIPNYTKNFNKTFSSISASETNGSDGRNDFGASLWANTAAITSLVFDSPTGPWNFVAGTTATLYGINRIPTASLGAPPTADVFVVAGGGSAGYDWAAGGGGGGVQYLANSSITSGSSITVTVGAGGAGSTSGGANGTNSSFGSTVIAIGGGKGGSLGANGSAGGSGGGGNQYGNNAGGAATAGTGGTFYGNAGGTGYTGGSGAESSAGGGGAGAAGGNGSSSLIGGAGGAGIASTMTGISTYYAGGGGGAGRNGHGAGGVGGGGPGGLASTGADGKPGTGGGGGGDTHSGGSGIVIIRYPDTYTAPTAVTGSPMVNHINGYRVYTWFNSGSITF